MPEYRPVPDERREEFRRITSYAFAPERGPGWDGLDEESLRDRRAIFEDDEMVSVCGHYWFDARLRGGWHAVPGLSAVATPPQHRHRGLVRRLLAESLAEYRDRDAHFSMLWPFEHSYYAKYGWGTVNDYLVVDVSPGELADAAGDREGRFRPVGADDWESVAPVQDARASRYSLSVDRTEAWWRNRIFEGGSEDPYVQVFERDGEVRGYVVYRVEDGDDGDDGRVLVVWEAAWRDVAALRHLLRFCHYHDSQVETVRFYEPPDTPVIDLLADRGAAEVELRAGPMFRVVDVARGLSALDYPEGAEADLALAVSDPLVEANDGTFRLSVGDGAADCRRDDGADPDLRLDVNALSQAVAGYRPVEDLARTAPIEGDEDDVALLSAVFSEDRVFVGERF